MTNNTTPKESDQVGQNKNTRTNDSTILKNTVLSTGMFKLDGGAMFGIIPKPLWNKVAPADEYNRIDLDLRLWLLQTKDKKILVDTGIGDYHGEKFDSRFDVRQSQHPVTLMLKKVGLEPSDITDLIISHLHFDHAGGIGEFIDEQLVPTFPHATLHIHKEHYEYAKKPTQRDAGSFHHKIFVPIVEIMDKKNMVQWHSGPEGEIIKLSDSESINFICSHGHTPHLMHPYTNNHIYLADLIPTSNHVHIPWVMGYDIAPGITTEDKERFLSFIEQNDLKVIYEHDPKYWGSTIVKNEKGNFVVGELFNKSEDAVDHL